jgi:tight adherence protein B
MNEFSLLLTILGPGLTVLALAYALNSASEDADEVSDLISRSRRLNLIGEWLNISPGTALAAYLATQFIVPMLFLLWRPPFAVVVFFGVLAAFVTAPGWLARKLRLKSLKLFDEQLPPFTDRLVSSVRGDTPLLVSIEQVAPNLDEPIRSEIIKLADDANRGRGGVDLAIQNARKRYTSKNYSMILSVMHVFSRRGGDLIEPIQNMSSSFKEIYRLEKKLETAVSAAKNAFFMVNFGLLAIIVIVSFARPETIDEIFDTALGILLFFAGLLIYGFGVFMLRMMTRVEV